MPDEKTHADALFIYLTGAASDGAAQTDPDLSLGDYRGSSEWEVLDNTITSPIANVTVDFVAGANGVGAGTLDAASADTLTWAAPGGSTGAAVTIANGETKILEDGTDTDAYIRVTRTTADALSGTATCTLAENYNNVVGFDNVSSGEATAGDTEYRCLCFKNESASTVQNLKVVVATLGTQRTTAASQLGASGAGTIGISAGTFADWDDSGWARIEDSGGSLREIVYYSSRTSTELTVPAAGREALGTTNDAGAADDTVDNVPGMRMAKEAPSSQSAGYFTDKTGAGEGSQPAGLTWRTDTSFTGSPVDIGDLSAGEIYGLWIEREIPAGAVAEASVISKFLFQYDSA